MPKLPWLLLLAGFPAHAADLRVAAASDLQFALPAVIRAYEATHASVHVVPTFGSSGKFLAQIREGAPFDLFFSADEESARGVEKSGHSAGAIFPYARGRLVLWATKHSALPLDEGLTALKGAKRIAVANPAHAPYGVIARDAIRNAGLEKDVATKIVYGENISQTAQFVEKGGADVGLVARSLAESPALQQAGRFVPVAERFYVPLKQCGVVLKGAGEAEASRFRDFLRSPAGAEILRKFGLDPL